MLPAVAALFLAWFVWLLATQCDSEERGKMSALFFLIVISTVFWSMFEQSGGSMTLFADQSNGPDAVRHGIDRSAIRFRQCHLHYLTIAPLCPDVASTAVEQY